MPTNKPLVEIQLLAQRILDSGGSFYQKWTCGGCGERVMMEKANLLFASAFHEDCGYTTDLLKTGCGLTAVLTKGTV